MTNIQTVKPESAGAAGPILENVKSEMGSVPNIFATMAQSPAVLEGFLAFSGALASGTLSAQLREQIALAVAGENKCDYCASAHTAIALGAGIEKEEATRNLAGSSSDNSTQAILDFVVSVVAKRGEVSTKQIETLRSHVDSEAEIVEIMANIGINLFTNYFNHVAATEIDFPLVTTQAVN